MKSAAHDPANCQTAHWHSSAPTKRTQRLIFYAVLALADLCAIGAALLTAKALGMPLPSAEGGAFPLGLILPLYLAFAASNGAFGPRALYRWSSSMERAGIALLLSATSVALIVGALRGLAPGEPARVAVATSLALLGLVACRYVLSRGARAMMKGDPFAQLVIADGVDVARHRHADAIDAARLGIVPDHGDPLALDRLGRLLERFDRVMVWCAPERRRDWALLLNGAAIEGHVRDFDLDGVSVLSRDGAATPGAIRISSRPLEPLDLFRKRLLDLAVALPALALLAPLMAAIAIAIRLESPGPALFVQQRLGRSNRLFRMYKFRSMRDDVEDSDGLVSTARGDARVTRVGRLIRATSMDELPQLFNVLMGSMSIVGPRPHALGSRAGDKLFWEVDRRYWLRHACNPGITGLAQVRGLRGSTFDEAHLRDRLDSDLEYVRAWSLRNDIGIIARTFGVVLHKNAF